MLLCPHRYCERGVTEIRVKDLADAGVQAVLLDLDNTLVGWQRRDVSPEVLAWLDELRAAGIKMCLISNTHFGKRLKAMSEELGIPYVRRAVKPRPHGFRAALKELGVEPGCAVMVGDQMFTDVLGANRMGIRSYMVKPMGRREFVGTKISRMAEYVVMGWFRRRGCLRILGSERAER